MKKINKIRNPAHFVPYVIAALVVAVVVYVRIRLLAVPLERDEGEYAYMGQLLLKGIPPFSHAYTMKLPGVSIMYAFFMSLFGQTPAGIHLGLLIVNGTCVCLVYLLAKRLFDRNAALFSGAIYAVLSLSDSVVGLFAHATHFVMLFALAGFLWLFRALEKRQKVLLFVSGLCFGLAVTMKQHAALFLMFAVLYFVSHEWRNPHSEKKACSTGSFIIMLGAIIPYVLIISWMFEAGNFADFWFWTVQYARAYTSNLTIALGWNNFNGTFATIMELQLPFWLLAGFGCVVLAVNKGWCADRLFVVGFLLFSFLAICPGWMFRGHYIVLLLPAVALLAGAVISSSGVLLRSTGLAMLTPFMPSLLLVMAITYNFYHEKDIYFAYTPLEVSRATYGPNPFPEALLIAAYIRDSTTPGEQIAVLGSEPEIYFYADRLAASGHMYMYGLMENQPYAERMQRQMIREIEEERPTYIVDVHVGMSWLVQKRSVGTVFYWAENYLGTRYERVGVIDIIGSNSTRSLWGNKAAWYKPVSEDFVVVYKRKSGG